MTNTQDSRMPSPTQHATRPSSTATRNAEPAEASTNTFSQQQPLSQQAPNPKAVEEVPVQDRSVTPIPVNTKIPTTGSVSKPNTTVSETPEQPDRNTSNENSDENPTEDDDHQQPAEPQHEPENSADTSKTLQDLDWDDLQARYQAKMEECDRHEEAIEADFKEYLDFFDLWKQMGSKHEEERASKRLRTRMAFVQTSEAKLQEKQKHYKTVVQAFESALALLAK